MSEHQTPEEIADGICSWGAYSGLRDVVIETIRDVRRAAYEEAIRACEPFSKGAHQYAQGALDCMTAIRARAEAGK